MMFGKVKGVANSHVSLEGSCMCRGCLAKLSLAASAVQQADLFWLDQHCQTLMLAIDSAARQVTSGGVHVAAKMRRQAGAAAAAAHSGKSHNETWSWNWSSGFIFACAFLSSPTTLAFSPPPTPFGHHLTNSRVRWNPQGLLLAPTSTPPIPPTLLDT